MKQIFKTIEQANSFVTKCNELLGYPDGNGTETYAIPEEVKETIEEVETVIGYEIPINFELSEMLVELAVKQLTDEKILN